MNKSPPPSPPGITDNNPDTALEPDPEGAASLPAWLQSQLSREFAKVMSEPLPLELLELVRKLEDAPEAPDLPSRPTNE